jgi:hypothetical protein
MSLNQDLLAELELTMVPSLRSRPAPDLYVPAGDLAEAAGRGGSSRRNFWCALKEHDVEVEFETKRFLGLFPRPVGVKRCSAFEKPEQVACGRQCLDSRFRRQWPFALPIADPRPALED